MKAIIIRQIFSAWILILLFSACSAFLDVKPDEKLAVPSTLEDFQAIMNAPGLNSGASEGEVMAGDYYLNDDDFEALFCESDIEAYSWKDSRFIQQCDGDNGWPSNYSNIYVANIAIEGIDEYEKKHGVSEESSTIKGHAYFLRAVNHFEVAMLWANYYGGENGDDPGIPLKLIADFNLKTERSSLADTYTQVIEDLKKAADLLPMVRHTYRWPGKYAAWGYLARVYLYMGQFKEAAVYAEKCIVGGHHPLMDYNTINTDVNYPFNLETNTETFVSRTLNSAYYSLNINIRHVDVDLYDSYAEEDLRKKAFFRINADGTIRFKGNQSGSGSLFCAPTLGEMYLILAETYARDKDYINARKYLTDLLKHRMETDYIFPKLENEALLGEILLERRKELLLRGVRFGDVKRLNKLGENITLKRIIMGKEVILPPNDARFTLLIPDDVIRISGIPQNKR